jgi:hypothetical protein
MNNAKRIVFLGFFLLIGCSDNGADVTRGDSNDELALENRSAFPIGNVIFLEDDPRFIEYQSSYLDVIDIIESESDYVGHDELFRIRETHPTPHTTNYGRLDAFINFAES